MGQEPRLLRRPSSAGQVRLPSSGMHLARSLMAIVPPRSQPSRAGAQFYPSRPIITIVPSVDPAEINHTSDQASALGRGHRIAALMDFHQSPLAGVLGLSRSDMRRTLLSGSRPRYGRWEEADGIKTRNTAFPSVLPPFSTILESVRFFLSRSAITGRFGPSSVHNSGPFEPLWRRKL
jgi:hypothetical protein